MSLSNQRKLVQRLLNKQEALLSFHEITFREMESRLSKYKGMIESLKNETLSLRGMIDADSGQPSDFSLEPQQVKIYLTHKLISWMFFKIVCVNELNPKTVASDMLDLLRATYLPLILKPMVDFDFGYDIPQSFYESRPGDFAQFIVLGRILLKNFLSEVGTSHLNEKSHWEEYSNRVHSWLVTEGLPLLYGVGDDEWYYTNPLTWEEYFNGGVNSEGYVLTAESYLEKYNQYVPTDFSPIERSLTDKMVELNP